MEQESKEYKGIFKSTFLFGFVQVVRLLAGIIRNKVAAVILGPSGMGIIGVFNSTITFIKIGAGLGVSQSAVRDVSEANGCGDRNRFSRTISLTNRIVWFTALLGLVVTIVLSPLLSQWGFGDKTYTFAFIVLSLAVAADIFVDNQLAILKGMRRLRSLAKASIIGSLAALVTGVPLFYFFGEKGIVPSIIISAFATLFVSVFYVRKISYDKVSMSIKEVFYSGKSMLTMGVSLMLVSFIAMAFNYIIITFIRSHGGLDTIGIYTAGSTIISSYFGIVISAMTTDYYPRISAINKDNEKLQNAMNQQSEVGLILVFPLAILFLFLSRFVLSVLYTEEFYAAVEYTDFAMLGTIISVCSGNMSMILLAKQEPKIFLISVICQRVLMLAIFLILFSFLGLKGLGIAFFIQGVVDLIVAMAINGKFYHIYCNKRVLIDLLVILVSCSLAIWIRRMDGIIVYVLGLLLFLLSLLFTNFQLKKSMNLNLFTWFKNLITKKRSKQGL